MANKKEDTSSFVLRLSQKIYESEAGEPEVQWRGSIRHVQSGEEQRFSSFATATEFMQDKLSEMTRRAVEDKSAEEQKGILAKSFDLWRKVASSAPKVVAETLKDPKRQAELLQEQLQGQIHDISESITARIEETIEDSRKEIESRLPLQKADLREMMSAIADLNAQVKELSKKVDNLERRRKKKANE